MRGLQIEENAARADDTLRVYRGILLAALTTLALYLCWRLAAPFINAFTWGLALTISCLPLRDRMFARLPRFPATLLIMTLAIVAIAVPVAMVLRQLLQESIKAQSLLRNSIGTSDWQNAIAAHPWVAPLWTWADRQLDLSEIAQKIATAIAGWIAPAVAGSLSMVSQTGAALLAFFFFLRDEETALAAVRRMLPLSPSECDLLFGRVSSAIRSAVYGRLFIGFLQGALGGVIFALVGLPAPIFWGAVMSFLSVLPVLGAFVVWIPACIFLLLSGHWIAGLIVLVWGVAVINPVDNFLYPVLVGAQLGLHPLILFVAFLGGLIAFGPSGLILGPCIVSVAVGFAEVWRTRHDTAIDALSEKCRG